MMFLHTLRLAGDLSFYYAFAGFFAASFGGTPMPLGNFNYEEKESFGAMGFSKQEFNENEELVDVEENQDDSDTDDFMDAFDDSILDEE